VDTNVFDQALGQIKAEPHTWRQTSWGVETECGTAYCLAGHIVTQAGYQMVWEPWDVGGVQRKAVSCVAPSGGRMKLISQVAQRLLGVNETQAEALFDGANDLEDLEHLGKALANGQGIPSRVLAPNGGYVYPWRLAE
jgi:hypothetical protein